MAVCKSRKSRNSITPSTIVIDLDETLIRSWQDPAFIEEYDVYFDNKNLFLPPGCDELCYSVSLREYGLNIWGMYRPYMKEFLTYALDTFDNVVIWSAGIDPYVSEIVKLIFGKQTGMKYPNIVFTRDDCVKDDRGFYHKPIEKLMQNGNPMNIDPKRTVVVDDKAFTFTNNPKYGLLIPAYHPGRDIVMREPGLDELLDRNDDKLLKLVNWMREVDFHTCDDFADFDLSSSKIFE